MQRTCRSGNVLNQLLSAISSQFGESVYYGCISRGYLDTRVTIKDEIRKEEFNPKISHFKIFINEINF